MDIFNIIIIYMLGLIMAALSFLGQAIIIYVVFTVLNNFVKSNNITGKKFTMFAIGMLILGIILKVVAPPGPE
tara:strand:- start:8124 stop:8342 length:219 start_codon:yes stop_codon:yes gene_type:complete